MNVELKDFKQKNRRKDQKEMLITVGFGFFFMITGDFVFLCTVLKIFCNAGIFVLQICLKNKKTNNFVIYWLSVIYFHDNTVVTLHYCLKIRTIVILTSFIELFSWTTHGSKYFTCINAFNPYKLNEVATDSSVLLMKKLRH